MSVGGVDAGLVRIAGSGNSCTTASEAVAAMVGDFGGRAGGEKFWFRHNPG